MTIVIFKFFLAILTSGGIFSYEILEVKLGKKLTIAFLLIMSIFTLSTIFGIIELAAPVDRVGPSTPLGPRARLARDGVSWSVDNFRKAIREGNRDDIVSFLEGGMKPTDDHSENSAMSMVMAEIAINKGSYSDLDWILDQFVRFGVDLNRPVIVIQSEGAWVPLAWLAHRNSQYENDTDAAYIFIRHGAKPDIAIKALMGDDLAYLYKNKADAIKFLRSL
jgi:hypothetical protein